MNAEERRHLAAVIAGGIAGGIASRGFSGVNRVASEPALIARMAVDITSAIEDASDDAEVGQLQRQQDRRAPMRVADPESAAGLCADCGVVPIEREGAEHCDRCWTRRCERRAAELAGALDRNVQRALTFPCTACDAEPGEGCRGLEPGDTVHGVRMERVRAELA